MHPQKKLLLANLFNIAFTYKASSFRRPRQQKRKKQPPHILKAGSSKTETFSTSLAVKKCPPVLKLKNR